MREQDARRLVKLSGSTHLSRACKERENMYSTKRLNNFYKELHSQEGEEIFGNKDFYWVGFITCPKHGYTDRGTFKVVRNNYGYIVPDSRFETACKLCLEESKCQQTS